MVATQLVGFAVMLAIVVVLSLVYMPEARDTVWLSIPLAALAACLVAGLSLAVASLNAVYRDVEHLVAALLLPWFFLTPVLYSLESIPGVEEHPHLVDVVHYGNPLTPAIEAVRDPLFFGRAAGRPATPSTSRSRRCSRSRSEPLSSAGSTTAWQSKSDPAVEDRRLSVRVVGRKALMLAGLEPARSEGSSSGWPKAGLRPPPGAHGAQRAVARLDRATDRREALRVRVEHAP